MLYERLMGGESFMNILLDSHFIWVTCCWRFKTVLKFTASLRVTWCLFHQGGSSLDLSIQGSEANSQDFPCNLSIYPNTKHWFHKKINLKDIWVIAQGWSHPWTSTR
jgi:hypothetical protein